MTGTSAEVPPGDVPAPPAVLRRLHPATLLVWLVRFARTWGVPLVLIVFVAGGEADLPWWFWMAFTSAILSGVIQVARVLSFQYGFEGDRLVLREGILFRQVRTIPLARVQNVNLKRGVIHRLCGVAEVRVETAGASDAEAELCAIGKRAAEEFRRELLARRGAASEEGPPPPSDLVRASTLGEILLAGATENRAGVIAAGLYAAFELADDFGLIDEGRIEGAVDAVAGSSATGAALAAAALLLLLAVAGWGLSLGFSLLTWAGFTLRRSGQDLLKRHGLLTRYEAAVPLARVQLLRLEANWPRRALGMLSIAADTAGSASDHRHGGTTILCPLLGRAEAPEFARVVWPDLVLEAARWRPVHPRARRRAFVRYGITGLVLASGILWWRLPAALAAGALAILVSYLLARAWYRACGFEVHGRFLLARAGIWTLRHWIVPAARIQALKLAQSPMQRLLGLATLVVSTAGTSALARVRIHDLGLADASALLDHLTAEASAAGARLAGV